MAKPEIKRIVRLQFVLTAIAVLIAAVLGQGSISGAVSALLGGLTVILPALLYIRIAYSVPRASPAVLMKAHYKAEAVKFVMTILIFAVVLLFFKDISVAAYFASYMLVVFGYWFGLLIKIEKK
ncbi:ATP synthase subunit I [Craterilacuibacter sp. RT1T]|uniref:ATP synthase subunit I n=1 Tax=Craterilacuibacter sp. RT1T TaxID=2942211 RepID=UPI0020BD941B|nr:ATP synthase subunit I [Craterilacuibacter sp. RT1T]MCL6264538.1 ATP synthase subunit I [Craterilacuibacter sp. RT1T]